MNEALDDEQGTPLRMRLQGRASARGPANRKKLTTGFFIRPIQIANPDLWRRSSLAFRPTEIPNRITTNETNEEPAEQLAIAQHEFEFAFIIPWHGR
jgi:hypothetical protein